MAFFESNYPTAEAGTVNAAGTFSVNGQEYSQTAQVQGRSSSAGNVVAVRVGRRRAVIGTGGFFAARTTHEEP